MILLLLLLHSYFIYTSIYPCSYIFFFFFYFFYCCFFFFFFFSSRRRHTRCLSDWSSDVCSSDLRPRITESQPCCLLFGGEFGRCFDDRPQRVAHFPCVFSVGEVDAPKLVQIGRASCRERV